MIVGHNVFDELKDDFLESEMITVHAKISETEDFEEAETNFKIVEVIKGNLSLQNKQFSVNNSKFDEDYNTYLADLQFSWYESASFPNIECINITPVN